MESRKRPPRMCSWWLQVSPTRSLRCNAASRWCWNHQQTLHLLCIKIVNKKRYNIFLFFLQFLILFFEHSNCTLPGTLWSLCQHSYTSSICMLSLTCCKGQCLVSKPGRWGCLSSPGCRILLYPTSDTHRTKPVGSTGMWSTPGSSHPAHIHTQEIMIIMIKVLTIISLNYWTQSTDKY